MLPATGGALRVIGGAGFCPSKKRGKPPTSTLAIFGGKKSSVSAQAKNEPTGKTPTSTLASFGGDALKEQET
jgi:hypothetical protein